MNGRAHRVARPYRALPPNAAHQRQGTVARIFAHAKCVTLYSISVTPNAGSEPRPEAEAKRKL
jgi:hypothetical protein